MQQGNFQRRRILASPEELPEASYPVVRSLFVLLQLMYAGFSLARWPIWWRLRNFLRRSPAPRC
jgi:hypothetical protein